MTALKPWQHCGIHYEAATPAQADRRGRETRPARPARVRLTGWLGGSFTTDEPGQLRQIAAEINDAADALAAQQAADAGHQDHVVSDPDPHQLQLQLLPR